MSIASRAVRRVLAAPLARLLCAGGAAFVLLAVSGGVPAPRPRLEPPLSGTASDEEVLYRAARALLAADDPVVRRRLATLARYLDLEAGTGGADDLTAAADALGLAHDDVVVRRYLLEMTRLALARPGAADLPGEGAVAAHRTRHPERFSLPARVRLTHVYLSRARRGDGVATDAARLLSRLWRGQVSPEVAAGLGDPFVRGARFAGSPDALARALGPELADAAARTPLATWQGPFASPYGLHLLWVEERREPRPAPLEDVRARIVHDLLRERGEVLCRERLAALRARETSPHAAAGAPSD